MDWRATWRPDRRHVYRVINATLPLLGSEAFPFLSARLGLPVMRQRSGLGPCLGGRLVVCGLWFGCAVTYRCAEQMANGR